APPAHDDDGDGARFDVEAKAGVAGKTKHMADCSLDDIGVANHHDARVRMFLGEISHAGADPLADLLDAFASRRAGSAALLVPDAPIVVLIKLSEGLAGPAAEVDFVELIACDDRANAAGNGNRLRGLLRALAGACG